MGRTPCCEKQSMKKGSWSSKEDEILTNYVNIHGEGKWRKVAENSGLNRCSKSCRLRWLNYLKPGIKRGQISEDEEDLIIRLHYLLGNRWSLIAGRLPGRTDNEIKNYWNTILVKKLRDKKLPSIRMKQQAEFQDGENYEGDGVRKDNIQLRNIEGFESPIFYEYQDDQIKKVIAIDDKEGQFNTDHEVELFNNHMQEKKACDDDQNFLMSNEFDKDLLQDDPMEPYCLGLLKNENHGDYNIGGGNDFIISSSSSNCNEIVKVENENEIKCDNEHTLDLDLKKLAWFLDVEDDWSKW